MSIDFQKVAKKARDLDEMLTQERQKSENYLEKALKHESESKNHLSILASMKNELDDLSSKVKENEIVETMFCDLKAKYAYMQIDHSASITSSDKQNYSKNEEIIRLGNKIEEVILQ